MIKAPEPFDEFITRIYPELCTNHHENGNHNVKTITFQVTENCNLQCTYCYEGHKTTNTMSFDVAKKMVDYIFQNANNPEFEISYNKVVGIIFEFIGGEPLLEVKLIDQIISYIRQILIETNSPWLLRHKFSICTNGMNYFSDEVQALLKKHHGYLIVNVTVDGCKEMHDACRIDHNGNGSYDKAIAAAIHLKDNYNQQQTKITISPYNVNMLSQAVKNMFNLGFNQILANCVFEDVWTPEASKLYFIQLMAIADWLVDNNLYNDIYFSLFDDKHCTPESEENNQNWCGGTHSMLSIRYNGELYPCVRYMETSLCGKAEPYVIGDIVNGCGLCSTQEQCDRVNELVSITRRSQSTDECFYCPIATGCAGCSAYNYQCFGTSNKRSTSICMTHKFRAIAMAYFYRRIEEKENKPHTYISHVPQEWIEELLKDGE